MTEDRGRMTDDRGQRTDDRGQSDRGRMTVKEFDIGYFFLCCRIISQVLPYTLGGDY